MSTTNFFAALDDSDDEKPKVAAPVKKATTNNKSSNAATKTNGGGGANNRRRQNNGGNDRNTKGGRGPRAARDGKRTYDRRSGTGRGKEIKKGGGGARNWGSNKDEAKKSEGRVYENELSRKEEEATAPPAETQEPEEEETPEEPEVTMTLAEYYENKKNQAPILLGPRKEVDVEEIESEFAGKTAFVSSEENFLVMGTGKSLRKKKSGKKEVKTIDLNLRFSGEGGSSGGGGRDGGDRRGGRGGRGGRGERRNEKRGGRGAGKRGGRGGDFALDDSAFPSL
jgi:plasminogen activator inhibitor 1 RNA-binding protein